MKQKRIVNQGKQNISSLKEENRWNTASSEKEIELLETDQVGVNLQRKWECEFFKDIFC